MWFKRAKEPVIDINFEEVHQYVEDIKEMVKIRDDYFNGKIVNSEEVKRYTEIIKIMQLVMLEINKIKGVTDVRVVEE